jgi:hypothetical protein
MRKKARRAGNHWNHRSHFCAAETDVVKKSFGVKIEFLREGSELVTSSLDSASA